ncbi:cupin domain-containing protein [Mycobacterium sp. NPDC050041]|uniref:cupin domain-containing protein n=1 Tax=Mycobacterium sp. NPDC050041 TaxID=3364293 RepID=UPI003C2D19A1
MRAGHFGQGVLAAAVAAVVAGCGSSAEPQAAATPRHPSETLAPLFEQPLPGVAGKTFTSAIVTFPPDARAVPHRHGDAFVYAYVLEGSVRSRLEGGPALVYQAGQNWSEQPGAHHVATENTSTTDPAKLLVVFIAETGQPLKVDDPHG